MSSDTPHGPSKKAGTSNFELRKFASLFTYDWRSHADSLYRIASDYIRQLPSDRKEVLQREFRAFLFESNADSEDALLKLWHAQGAEAWDLDLTVRPVMTDFLLMMNPEAPDMQKPTGSPTDATFHIGLKPRRSTP